MKKISFFIIFISIFYINITYANFFSKKIISNPDLLVNYFSDEIFVSIKSTNLNIKGKIYSKNQAKFIFMNFLKKYKFNKIKDSKIIEGDNKVEKIILEAVDLKRNKQCSLSFKIFFIKDKDYIINKIIILQSV